MSKQLSFVSAPNTLGCAQISDELKPKVINIGRKASNKKELNYKAEHPEKSRCFCYG